MVTANQLTSGSGSGASSFNTASISPTAKRLVIIAVTNQLVGGNIPTVTGASMTWTQISTQTIVSGGSGDVRLTFFRALSAAPGTGALTIDFGGQTQGSVNWSITEFDKIDTSGTNGANAVIQSSTHSASGVTSLSVNMAAFSNVNNATYAAIGLVDNVGATIMAGFTELSSSSNSEFAWKNSHQDTITWTLGAPGTNAVGAGIEIKASTSNNLLSNDV